MTISTPYYQIDIDKLNNNINGNIKRLREEANCKVLIALKGFSIPPILSIIANGLDGTSASGLYESILGKSTIDKDVCTYSPAFKEDEIEEISKNSSIVIFNSIAQFEKYHKLVYYHHASCGIRVNPECSTLPKHLEQILVKLILDWVLLLIICRTLICSEKTKSRVFTSIRCANKM